MVFYFVYWSEGFLDILDLFGVVEVLLGIFYGVFIIFWLVGFFNVVNLIDGIDGLVVGLGIILFGIYVIIVWK